MNQNKTNTHNYLCAYADKLRIEGLSDEDIFGTLLEEFNGTPYIWGGASLDGSDCSGTVCSCLNAIFNTKKRVTADSLFRNYFTEKPEKHGGIQAAFFLDENGKAVHVAGCIGDGVYLNESRIEKNGGTPRTLSQLKAMYFPYLLVRRKLGEKRWA